MDGKTGNYWGGEKELLSAFIVPNCERIKPPDVEGRRECTE